jgi:lysozyme
MIDTIIDLYHKGHIDLAQVHEQDGIIAIIHKATQGAHRRDPSYTSRKKTAKDIGLLWGAYHFGTADDVEAQVDNFLSTADVDEGVLIGLDFEEDPHGPGITIQQARDFVALTQEKTGRFPVIYGANLLRESLGSVVDPLFKKCP